MRRACSGRGRARRARVAVSIIVATAFLAVPGTAGAHSGAPTVALDFRLDLSPATRALTGVRVDLVGGDRGLRVRVDPETELIVLGELGEPFLRFDSGGVWVNRGSPTAAGARLARPSTESATSWLLLTHGHSVRWHDHRLAPPRTARTGVAGSWSIPSCSVGGVRPLRERTCGWRAPDSLLWPGPRSSSVCPRASSPGGGPGPVRLFWSPAEGSPRPVRSWRARRSRPPTSSGRGASGSNSGW